MINEITILGVKIDVITKDQAVDQVLKWIKDRGKHYIVTTNIEFIIAAQKDSEFKKILNNADLSISDSNRIDWAYKLKRENKLFKKILLWPLFLVPNLLKKDMPTVPGVDLMEELCRVAKDQGFTIGLLGGGEKIAEKVAECLGERYPGLKINFVNDGGEINSEGESNERVYSREYPYTIHHTDILFVAFGHVKQEKWIAKNMNKVDAKVFMGVGGAFDYLSGSIPRAPKWLRNIGLEWLFRLFIQPQRIKRFGSLVKFVVLCS